MAVTVQAHIHDGEDLGYDATKEVIYGYISALLQVNMEDQLDQCTYFIDHAEQGMNDALTTFTKINHLGFAYIGRKWDLFTEGLGKIWDITPQMFEDLQKCNIVGHDAGVIGKWLDDHPTISGDISTITVNLTTHIWGMTTQVL